MKIRLFLIAFCFCFSVSSHSHLKIGTLIYLPPFVISQSAGYDIDLSRFLCKQLKESCTIIPMGINQLYDALSDNKIDLAIGGIPISLTNSLYYIFSTPYMITRGQFLISSSSPFHSIKDLRGTTIGVIHDSLNGGILYNYLIDNYPGQFTIKKYDDIEDLINDLSNKTISAAFLYHGTVRYWSQNANGQFKPLNNKMILVGNGLAIMALPKNIRLINRINRILLRMEQEKIFATLYNTYLD
ncbi:transporter substrate-binding domain-containing protein [Legionella fallonii]|uniref:ABC-type amino acid transport/signal transduction systems, periplasmic component/domain protein n=1 Tax=Legionella fallonii LLAP-10 TaxID=1212491 RepID=A0A098G880_9GAMM|nr:transporter substrate-binding domain-containing protein [Legionella fallonii]CEG58191.1 ABC-type amino acid transport/signal transduction systems, periplasmic component/domain protein [Legionella fallonii LLAP-10]